MKAIRLDVLLVSQGLVPSREQAHRRILAGEVAVNGQVVLKPSKTLPADAEIVLEGEGLRFASRGGYKLEKALNVFDVNPAGKVVLDAGASTGGFTDCLLQHGARLVYAVDVGYGQIAWNLRHDPRVRLMERTNIRHAVQGMFDPPIQMATADLAFIGLAMVLHVFAALLPENGELVALVKPQFEAGREYVGRGGVVRDPEVHRMTLESVVEAGVRTGLVAENVTYSPLRGPAGNIEFLMLFRRTAGSPDGKLILDIADVVRAAHENI